MTGRRLIGCAALVAAALYPPQSEAADAKAPTARELAAAVQQHGAKLDADRAVVRKALERPDVREVAEKVGIDLNHIAATIDTLPPSDVATAAQAAQEINKRLTEGGRGTSDSDGKHRISYTTILISALLAVLLVVLVQ